MTKNSFVTAVTFNDESSVKRAGGGLEQDLAIWIIWTKILVLLHSLSDIKITKYFSLLSITKYFQA